MKQVLNLEYLKDLKAAFDDGSDAEFVELISMFVATSLERMAELKNLLEAGEFERMRKAAHAIRSSALNIGAERFPEALLEIEFFKNSELLESFYQTAQGEFTLLLDALAALR